MSDGGGEYLAALQPVRGRDRVARFMVGLQKKTHRGGRFALREINGLPALVAEVDVTASRWAPRFVLRCDVDRDGAIREVHVVIATAKLERIGAIAEG
jgi:RNA polymerase sigma-70 factor, ECF subfamily